MSDLDLLHEVGQFVRPPAFDEIIEARRRRTRRTRFLAASTLGVAASIAVGALLATSGGERTEPPPVAPTPNVDFQIPAGQETIEPDIRPRDLRGFTAVVTVTNGQPAHRDDTSLVATETVAGDTTNVSWYCRAHDVPTWIAYAEGDLASDSPGGAHDWWTFRKCLAGESTSLEPQTDLGDYTYEGAPEQKTVRMVAIAPPSPELRECLAKDGPYCPLPDPIAATDAEFGFRLYERTGVRSSLELFGDAGSGEAWQLVAVTSINQVAWLLDRAVVAAPEADRLAFELPESAEYLIDVYVATGPHRDACIAQHADDIPDYEHTDSHVYAAAIQAVCGVDLRLVVDGTPVPPEEVDPLATGHFQELGTRLVEGSRHRVEVEVTRGNPRNIRYAVVVRTRTALP